MPKETKVDIINREITHVNTVEDSILLRCQFSPIWFQDLTQSHSKLQQKFLIKIDKFILKSIFTWQGPRIPKLTLKKKHIVGGFTLSSKFKILPMLQESK